MTQPSTTTQPPATAGAYLRAVAANSLALHRSLLAEGRSTTGVVAQAHIANMAAAVAEEHGTDRAVAYLARVRDEALADSRDENANQGVRAAHRARFQAASRLHEELAYRYQGKYDVAASPALQVATGGKDPADRELAQALLTGHETEGVRDPGAYVAGGQVPAATAADPALSMAPTLYVAWVVGVGLGEPRIALTGSRTAAVAALADLARALLQERLDYVPLALQGTPDHVSVQEALIGNGFRGSVRECEVAL